MIIPDINLLVYAHNQDDAGYEVARCWLIDLLEGEESIGIPLAVSVGFVRLATNPRVMSPPMTSGQAVSIIRSWLQRPNVVALDAGPKHFDHLQECLEAAGRAGRFVTDAHLAALALDHDADIHSADQDFRTFPSVRWRNPL